MKKIITLLVFLISFIFVVSCDSNHTHNMIYHEPTDSTCVSEGNIAYYECSICNKAFSDSEGTTEVTDVFLPLSDHIAGEIFNENVIESTCLSRGSYDEVTYCINCNTELSRISKETDYADHELIHVDAVEPSCFNPGYKEYDYCIDCDYSTFEEIPATGHLEFITYTEYIEEPTCTSTGKKIVSTCCKDCGTTVKEEEVILELKEHEMYLSEYLGPTCTNPGKITNQCQYCDYVTFEEIAPTGHKYILGRFDLVYDTSRCFYCHDEIYVEHVSSGLCACGYYFTPEYIYTIKDDGIYLNGIRNIEDDVYIPEKIQGLSVVGIESLSSEAFKGINVYIPKTLKYVRALDVGLPDGVFDYENVENVYIEDLTSYINLEFERNEYRPNYNKFNEIKYKTLYVENSFLNIGWLEIPQDVEVIKEYTFSYYSNIKVVTFHSHKRVEEAFSFCPNLHTLDFLGFIDHVDNIFRNESMKIISLYGISSALKGFKDFPGFHYDDSRDLPYILKIRGGELTDLVIPEGVEEIPANMFNGYHKLKSVVFSSTVKRIGENAFHNTRGIDSIKFSSGLEVVERLGLDCFSENIYIEDINKFSQINFIYEYEHDTIHAIRCDNLYVNGVLISNIIKIADDVEQINFNIFGIKWPYPSIILPTSVKKVVKLDDSSDSQGIVYYEGTISSWQLVENHGGLKTVYYYSESDPTTLSDYDSSLTYWYY